ncbi:MAG: 2,3,4,5-tetrahydropyridine-2,6-dicarboxylate N-succinyltransferase, partial [Burkholderiaceae bacterium]
MSAEIDQLASVINAAWEQRAELSPNQASAEIKDAVEQTIAQLNKGALRVAPRARGGQWTTHQWIKKA